MSKIVITVTAWNNGQHHASGAGYGFRVAVSDRDKHFDRRWGTVTLSLPGFHSPAVVNIDKASFWMPTCRELISRDIGQWLLAMGLAPWPKRSPPTLGLRPAGKAAFEVQSN